MPIELPDAVPDECISQFFYFFLQVLNLLLWSASLIVILLSGIRVYTGRLGIQTEYEKTK